ncbi:MAG: YfhO family protein, partial [Candidatus Omnitrophica bacterium]|nr:YfhO family protein [Candidatus Omnitrophota bacterium]
FRKFFPAFFHVGLAVCFFWPFISAGEISVFSYDNLGEIFPLFYYAKHNFVNILHGHAPWLWNPWIQNGFPFFSNHWDMIYYPLNWPVFLAPDKDLLTALTLKSFIEVAALGIFAYGFFLRELGNARWALFASVAYQMCSLLIFTMSIFPATSLYFAMTVYLYVLWSAPERRPITNFLLLSFTVVLILTSANVAFIFYACLSLGIISIYRFLTVKDGKKLFWLAAAGWFTGTLISSVRILSCLYGVTHGNRLLENFYTIHDRAYMAIRLFIPEIAGWMGPDALNVLKSPNLQLIFRQLELPASNPQNSFFVYFGVLPALLLIAAFLSPAKGKQSFWKVYAFVTLGIALFWQPLWGILSILSFPLNHFSYHAVILPVGICTLIGYAGMAWENGHIENKDFQNKLILCLMFVVSYFLVFMTYLFPSLTAITRIIFLLMGTGIVLYYVMRKNGEINLIKFYSVAGAVLNILSLALLILLTLILVLAPIPKKEGLGTEFILPFLWLCSAVALVFYGYHRNQEGRDFRTIIILLGLALVTAAAAVAGGIVDGILRWEQGVRVYAVDVLSGFVRLLLLLQAGVLAFNGIQKKIFSARIVFAVLLILTAADLAVFNARFNNITAPFYFKNAYYPKGFSYRDFSPDVRQKMNLANYRVNHIDRKDFNANKNLVFNVPTYSGTVGYMTPRFSRLLTAFGYPQGIYMLYPEDSTDDPRFLDLSAVRYSFNEAGGLDERSSSLARLNIIYSAEVIVDEDTHLDRLRSDTFDPHKTVLLSQPLPGNSGPPGPSATMIPIIENTPDRIEAKAHAAPAGILLFNESYDEGWKAFVDDAPVEVVRANYNFMACAVGAGEHRIRFVYAPEPYKRNIFLSLCGLAVFFLAGVVAFLPVNKNK